MYNLVTSFILFFLIGCGIGIFGTLLFFRMDGTWKQVVLGITSSLITGSTGAIIINYFNISKNNRAAAFLCVFAGLGVSIYFTFKKLCEVLKSQTDKNVIRILDIILGYDKFIKEYYEERKKVSCADFEKKAREYRNKELELIECERKLNSREKLLYDNEKNFSQQCKDKLFLDLPVHCQYVPSVEFVKLIPFSVESYNIFVNKLNKLTNECIKQYTDNKAKNEESFKAFLSGMGMFIASALFGTSKHDVRTHFRICNGQLHRKYAIVYCDSLSDDNLSDIPVGASLIEESFNAKRAIVASLNSDATYSTGTKWEDYMTYAFQCVSKDEKPFFSMAISIKGKHDYQYMLCFLTTVK